MEFGVAAGGSSVSESKSSSSVMASELDQINHIPVGEFYGV